MQAIVDHLLAWYAVPENGLLSVALIAFISATLLPMGSAPAPEPTRKEAATRTQRLRR